MKDFDIDNANVKDLKAKAKERGLSGYYKMNREQLVKELSRIKAAEAKVASHTKLKTDNGLSEEEKAKARAELAKRAEKVLAGEGTDDDDLLGGEGETSTEDTIKETVKLPNLLKRRFGKNVNQTVLREWTNEVWEGVFKLSHAVFQDSHYWMGTVRHVESKEVFQSVRLDYLINYARPPKGSAKLTGVAEQRAKIQAANS